MANNSFSFVDSIEGISKLKSQEKLRSFVLDEAVPFILANLYTTSDNPVVYVCQSSDKARNLKNAMDLLLGSKNVILFPELDQPFQFVIPDPLSLGQHIGALTSFITHDKPFLILSNDSLIAKVPNYNIVRNAVFQLSVGSSVKQIDLALKLEKLGFTPTYQVEMPGQFARRGEVFDIYPVTSDLPVRLDYFGNEIDEIRTFDPLTQRSLNKIQTVSIGPASSIASLFYESVKTPVEINSTTDNLTKRLYAPYFNNDSIFSYISKSTHVYTDDLREIELLCNVYYDQMKRLQELMKKEHDEVYPEPVFEFNEISALLKSVVNVEFVSWKRSDENDVIKLPVEHLNEKYYGINNWVNTAKELKDNNQTLIVISHQAFRLNELISDENIFGLLGDINNPEISEHNINLFNSGYDGGFQAGDYYLITDRELFGVTKIYTSNKKRNVIKRDKSFDAEIGDYVVHVEHGIAKFAGTVMKSFNGAPKEYLKLQYAQDDYLYVPMDQMDRVSRYIGSSQNPPTLHKLGGADWSKTQRKAKEAAAEVAEELLELYAEREIQTGFQFSKDNIWQMEMENSFPYTETPDQLQAIEDVKKDMASSKPMDRLICGDVGYGKTEVALRAAFKAVMDSKQVCILVPTTVLAQQHYNTFLQRLMAFPVRIKLMSRFVSSIQQKGIVEDIKNGDVDIVIGTHRLLSDDIHFKNLGLLIIDEEQRFGVEHKEYIKKIKSDVDVLTLSATPIPRTLQLSLTGVRNMSLIETPPEERIPIHTVVAEYDEQLVRNAIINELSRGGQVYYVHNRVRSINNVAGKIQELVPDARIRVGHGQMPEEQLEQVMMDFVQHEFDVLVCTTIIESGVDVPNANTLIIDHADMYGLTQLYQIRGRVGRSSKLAYAYFLYDKDKILTEDADKRLQTLFEASDLGAGMSLAMKDLEIRGAGNMLGTKQSGHIDSVGFNYYTQLLSEAVEELRNKRDAAKKEEKYIPKIKLPPPSVDLPILAFIPENYISNAEHRVAIYKRMATCNELNDFAILSNEIKDRFGDPPDEVKNLLFVVEMKIMAGFAMIASITKEDTKIVLRRSYGITFNPDDELNKRRGVRVMLHQIQITYTSDPQIWQDNLRYVISELGPKEKKTI